MTNIRKTPLYKQLALDRIKSESEHNMSSDIGTGREQFTGYELSNNGSNSAYTMLQRPVRPKVPNFFDQAYNTDIIKRARERPQSCKSGYSRKSNVLERIKTYKAPDPYQKSGSHFYKSKISKASKQNSVINDDNAKRFK